MSSRSLQNIAHTLITPVYQLPTAEIEMAPSNIGLAPMMQTQSLVARPWLTQLSAWMLQCFKDGTSRHLALDEIKKALIHLYRVRKQPRLCHTLIAKANLGHQQANVTLYIIMLRYRKMTISVLRAGRAQGKFIISTICSHVPVPESVWLKKTNPSPLVAMASLLMFLTYE